MKRTGLLVIGVVIVLIAGLWVWNRWRHLDVPVYQGLSGSSEPARQPGAMLQSSELADRGEPGPMGGEPAVGATLATLSASQPQRYLIRTALLSLEVDEAPKALERLRQLVKDNSGYVADLREWVDELGNVGAQVKVRVPASRFESMLAEVKTLGKALEVQVSSEDVTEEYVDIDAQLRNLKRTEERLLGHLSRSAKLADTLAVERELSRVRMEIERLEGRMRYLQHRIAYCTLDITLRPVARTQPLVPPQSFSSGKVASDAVRSLVGFAQRLWSLVIWLAVWAVVWLPLLLAGWYGYRRRQLA